MVNFAGPLQLLERSQSFLGRNFRIDAMQLVEVDSFKF
jgi:hypothetical protein